MISWLVEVAAIVLENGLLACGRSKVRIMRLALRPLVSGRVASLLVRARVASDRDP